VSSCFSRRLPWRLARNWVRVNLAVLRVLCGLDYRLEGRENIPAENAIAFWKHQSAWETLAQLVIFPEQCWVLKRELFRIPFFGWALAALRPVAIDRRRSRQALQQVLRQGRARLTDGLWVMIFPEGTRVAPGTTRRYGLSGALLAVETARPVIPVAHNAGDFWPRRGLVKHPGMITVRIGPPIATQGRTPAEVCALAQDWIEAQMREIDTIH
jgi:1-acyl-sn-glycerol-3-phosphate acyltransferase